MHDLDKHHHLPFHFHHHHWNMEIVEFYIFQTLFNIANSMVNLFLPIFLLTQVGGTGYPLWGVMLWFVILEFWCIVANPFSGKIVEYLGPKHAMFFSLPFMAFYYYALRFLTGDFWIDCWFIFLILGIRCIPRMGYNTALDIFMAHHVLKKKKNAGKMLALLRIIMVLAAVSAPLIGGFVAFFFSFDVVFNVGIALVVLSGIPLLLTPDEHFKLKYKPQDVFSFALHKVPHPYVMAETGRVFSDVLMWIVWPLFLYFIVQNTADLGVLVSASAFISMIVAYFVGKKVDAGKPEKLIKRGVPVGGGAFLFRALSSNPVTICVVDAIHKIVEPVYRIPYDRFAYKLVRHSGDQIEMANVKQFISEWFYFICTVFLFIIVLFYPEPSKELFVSLFVIFSFIMLLMTKITKLKFESSKKRKK